MREAMPPPFRELPHGARACVAIVVALAAAAAALSGVVEPGAVELALLGVIALCCASTGLAEAVSSRSSAAQATLVPFAWAAVALPAWTLPGLAALCVLPSARRGRGRWYHAAFNIGNYVLAGTLAHALVSLASDGARDDLVRVAALAAAALLLVALNHLLLGGVVVLSRRKRPRAALGDLRRLLPLDAGMALTGTACAELWHASPALVLLAIGPLGLVFAALSAAALGELTRRDPKTGLVNAAHFGDELADELTEARRTGAPLAVAMLDLDHLRRVNNTAGHLAGDRLIRNVADVLQDMLGHRGTVARFGGEEFSVLLPATTAAEAGDLLDATRARLEKVWVTAVSGGASVGITVSAGVAAFPGHGETPEALLEAADAALYDAKSAGRNRVRSAVSSEVRAALALGEPEARPADGNGHAVAAPPAPSEPAPPVPAPLPDLDGHRADPPPPERRGPGSEQARVRLYVVALALAAVAAGGLGVSDRVFSEPLLLAVLVVALLVVDVMRIDLFERAKISPAAVPSLALAFLFGPFGPMLGELAIAVKRAATRRESLVRVGFDFGALTLAGGAAALTFQLAAPAQPAATVLAATLAGGAYYAVNAVGLAVVMALAEGSTPLALWRERLAWLWPHYLVFGAIAGVVVVADEQAGPWALLLFAVPVAVLWLAEKQYVDRSRASVAELRRNGEQLRTTNERLLGLLGENQELLRRVHRSYLQTITSLARTIEAKDPYTGGHTERVAQIACVLATELGMTPEEIEAIEVGSVIHDIGKIGIPDAILLKPARLTEGEFSEMQRHPEISSYIVGELEVPRTVKQMARSHHERFDGRGYPDRLAGEEIPLPARILTVADALDAMTSDRPYRPALALPVALAELHRQAGRQFCPRVVATLETCLARDATLGGAFAAPVPVAS